MTDTLHTGEFSKEHNKFVFHEGTLRGIHPYDPKTCGVSCVVHNPTAHAMSQWELHWRADTGVFERLCPDHKVGHPDPDQAPYFAANNVSDVHGCCGCCKQ